MATELQTNGTAVDGGVLAPDSARELGGRNRAAGYLVAVAALLSTVGTACGSRTDASVPTSGGRASVDSQATSTTEDLGDPTTTVVETTVAPSTDAPTTEVSTTVAPSTDAPTTVAPTTDAPTTTIDETEIAVYEPITTFTIETLDDRVKAVLYLMAGATATVNLDGSYTFDMTTRQYLLPDQLAEGLVDKIASFGSGGSLFRNFLTGYATGSELYDLVMIDPGATLRPVDISSKGLEEIVASVGDGSDATLKYFADFRAEDDTASAYFACGTEFSFAEGGVPSVQRGIVLVQVFNGEQVGQVVFQPFLDGVPDIDAALGASC